ncbi:hypothetical protein Hanom_Chr07g00647751 [Helianthus anomalus]
MSSATKSSKFASRFCVGDIQEYVSPRSIKKELAASQSIPRTKGVSTRGKRIKRKKPAEPTKGLPLVEHQLQEYISEKELRKELLVTEMTAQRERIEVMEGAKHSVAVVMLKGWTTRLVELGDDEEPEEVLALEAGSSGAKDPEDAAAGSNGQGGEEKVEDAAKV